MRKSRWIFIITVLLCSFLSFPVDQSLAASDMAEVPLTIKQSFAAKNPAKGMDFVGNYEFGALDKESPMPEHAEDGTYSFSLNGKQAETTIYLQYSRAGIYRYQLKQTTTDKERYQYDKSCYDITVYVKNGENGELISQVVAEKGDGKKSGELEFQNSYQGNKSESSKPSKQNESGKFVKTGDSANIMVCALVAVGALLLIVLLVYFRKHNRKK